MHEVMEHVDIRIGSRDIRATVFATLHTPHDGTHPRGVRNKELVELGPLRPPSHCSIVIGAPTAATTAGANRSSGSAARAGAGLRSAVGFSAATQKST